MIKLDKNIYDRYKDKYLSYCINKIKENYVYDDTKLFNGKISRDDLFCTFNQLDDEKIRKILLLNFKEDSNDDSSLNYYFKTGLLISRLNCLKDELKVFNGTGSREKRKQYRKQFFNQYKNPWVEHFLDKYNNFYESNEKYENLIKVIKKEYTNLTILRKTNKKEIHVIEYSFISDIRDDLMASTNILVCPYCNRQFISSFTKDKDSIKSTSTLDHFYPKSKFPLFALSLYNFVPSCHICNETLKTQSVKKIMYPFKQGYENKAHFKITNYRNLEALLGKNKDFYVDIEIKDDIEEINNSIDLFKTKEIYEFHKDYIQSLINKYHVYSDTYRDLLKKDLKKLSLDCSEEGISAFLYNLDLKDKEQTNVILGRLTKDILEQIDELKKSK